MSDILKKYNILIAIFMIWLLSLSGVAATCNIIVITDPTGEDPNGAAAGSMSFAMNMFQSTFLMSKENNFAVLSGGTASEELSLESVVQAVATLSNGGSASAGASVANGFTGSRLVVGGPTIGAAVGGSFMAYVVVVNQDDGSISVTPYSGGLAVLEPGQQGGIIHLRNSPGNPLYGTADHVRKEAAINMGKMIRDGYPATTIVAETMGLVASGSGEKYGGGAVNIVSGISTGDMFTPHELNDKGYPMDEPYAKSCDECGWALGFPAADTHDLCPICGNELETSYAYQSLDNAITVTEGAISVSVYGSEKPGVSSTTREIVIASVDKYGYNPSSIADSINRAINNGLIVGVNHVEPKDINVKEHSKSVGVYFTPLLEDKTSPPWNLPVDPNLLSILGSIQTVIGIILILLVVFRGRLLKSFNEK